MKLEHISIQFLQAQCRGGSVLSECIREAAILALEQEKVVFFSHNEKQFTVDFKAIVDSIYKQHLE